MGFDESLDIGKQYEDIVLNMIQHKYPKAYKIEGYYKDFDIFIPELGVGVEVKSDQKSQYTGNIVIEIEYNGKPSALSTTKAAYWVVYDGESFVWFTPGKIQSCIDENNLTVAKFKGRGDHHFKKAYLIKKDLLYRYAVKINT